MTTPTAADFLAFRFRHNGPDDHTELRAFWADGQPGPRGWFADPHEAAREAAHRSKRLNLFYGATARQSQGGKKAHVTAIPGGWADLDFKRYEDGEAGAWAALAAFPLAPTWVIHTGGGLQVLWDFVAPLTDRAQFPAFEALLARLAGALNGDPAVAEIARVLRLPGSLNNKPEYGTPRPVTIARHNLSALYSLADFERVLPTPPEAARPQTAYPRGNGRTGDVPTVDELGDMLRHIDPQPGYKDWLTLLAAIHSAYPGADGEALAEAWSGHVSQPGEIAEKFKSFGNYRGTRGNATIASVIHAAKLGGWQPSRATPHLGQAPDAEEDGALVARLRADVARLGDELRAERAENARLTRRLTFADEEGERMVLRITTLETENRLLHETRLHADQTVAVGVWDAAAALKKRYERGEVKTQDGHDLAPVIAKYDAKAQSAATLGRCITRLEEAGVQVRRYEKTIKTENGNDKTVQIPHLFIPPEHRGSVPAIVRFLLPPSPAKKAQGGSKKRIAVPRSEEHPDAPLIRRHETIETFRSAITPGKVIPGSERLLTASETFWTKDGEPITQQQAIRIQVEIGYQPPPWYHPAPKSDRLQVDDLFKYEVGFQHEIGTAAEPEPEPLHGRCRYCGQPNLPGKHHCTTHRPGGDAWQAAVGERGYAAYAAGDD